MGYYTSKYKFDGGITIYTKSKTHKQIYYYACVLYMHSSDTKRYAIRAAGFVAQFISSVKFLGDISFRKPTNGKEEKHAVIDSNSSTFALLKDLKKIIS